jgi:hypothetical protein
MLQAMGVGGPSVETELVNSELPAGRLPRGPGAVAAAIMRLTWNISPSA